MRRMRKWAKRLAIVLGVAALSVLGLVLLTLGLLETPRGREWARPRIEGLLSRAIPGAIRIGRIERAEPGWIVLSDVVVVDPAGREVLRIAELEGRPSRRALSRGVVGFRSVRAKGVWARLIPSEIGGLTLIDAFDEGPDEPEVPPAAPPREIRIDRFRIEDGEARLELEGMPLDLQDVAIDGRVRSKETLDLVVERAVLRVSREGDVVFWTRDLEGAYRTGPGARSEVRALLVEAEDRVRVRAAMVRPDEDAPEGAPPTIEATVDLAPLTPRAVAALGARELSRELPSRARGRVEGRGTTERAMVRAILEVAGSDLRLDGMYTPNDSRAQLCAARLALSRLHRSLPEATVDGCARVAVGDFTAASFPARLELRGASVDGERIPDLRVTGTVDARGEAVAIRSLDLPRAERGRDRLSVEGRVTAAGRVELRLEARGFDPSADPVLAALVGGARGAIDARAALSLVPDPSRIDASLEATVDAPSAFGARARRISLSARAQGATDAPRFEITGRARGLSTGGFRIRRATIRANGTPEAAVVAVRGELGRGEPVHARLRASRAGSVYTVDGGGAFGDRAKGLRFRLVGLRYDPERDRAELRALRLAHAGGRALVRGTLEGDAVDVRAWIDAMPIDALARGIVPTARPVEGELTGTIALGGTTARPRAAAELRLDDAEGYGIDRGKGALVARLTPTGADVRFDAWARRRGAVELEASVRWPERASLDESLRAARYKMRAEVDTAGFDAQMNAVWDQTGLLAAGAAKDERGGLAAARVRSDATPRALGPDLDPFAFAFEAEATLFERPIAALPVRRPTWMDGALRVAGSASLANRPRRPLEGELHASLRGDLRPMAAPEDDCSAVGEVAVRLDGTIAGDRARATLEAAASGGRPAHAELAAQLPLARALRGRAGPGEIVADLEARITALDLRTVPVLCEVGVGTIDAEIAATDLGRPSADVRLALTTRGARLGPKAIFDVDAELRARGGKASALLVMSSDVGGSARVEAALPFTFGPDGVSPGIARGEVSIRSRFDHLTLEPFAPVSRFVRHQAGVLHGRLEVSGTADAPVATGALELRDSTLVVPVLDQRLSELDTRVRFTPGWVMVERLSARDLEGRVEIRGDARLDGLVPRSGWLEVETDGFPIRQEGVVTAALDAKAGAKFARTADGMVGNFHFERLAVRVPDESGRDVQDLAENPDIVYVDAYPAGWSPPPREAEREEADDDAGEASLTEELVPFELHIDASEPFWVKRSDFSVQLAAELDLAIAPGKAALTGEVKTLEGFVELVGTRFTLEEGAIHLVPGETIDPLLDMTALANAGTAAEVRVRITGSLSDPILAFADRSGQELTAGAALACISSARCDAGATEQAETSAGVESLTQQARGQLASITAGLLGAVARAGMGDRMPQITVSAGQEVEEVTVRAGFQANRLIPEIFRNFVKSLYIEGYVGTAAVAEDGGTTAQSTSTRATGGFAIEMRHPRNLVSRGRYEPPANWSLDMTWQP